MEKNSNEIQQIMDELKIKETIWKIGETDLENRKKNWKNKINGKEKQHYP